MQLKIDHIAVLQVGNLIADCGERNGIRGEEVLRVTYANHERHAVARAHQAMRFVAAKHSNRIAATQLDDGLAHGLEEIAVVQMIDQVGDNFAIGLAGKDVTTRFERRPQFLMIFDDAVVRQRNTWRLRVRREVRVCVVSDGFAVRRPTGMRDAGVAGQAAPGNLVLQVRYPFDAARAQQLAVVIKRHAA